MITNSRAYLGTGSGRITRRRGTTGTAPPVTGPINRPGAGNSWINAHNIFAHGIPYAGCNLSGIGGGVLGPETLLDYLRPQSVVRPLV